MQPQVMDAEGDKERGPVSLSRMAAASGWQSSFVTERARQQAFDPSNLMAGIHAT